MKIMINTTKNIMTNIAINPSKSEGFVEVPEDAIEVILVAVFVAAFVTKPVIPEKSMFHLFISQNKQSIIYKLFFNFNQVRNYRN